MAIILSEDDLNLVLKKNLYFHGFFWFFFEQIGCFCIHQKGFFCLRKELRLFLLKKRWKATLRRWTCCTTLVNRSTGNATGGGWDKDMGKTKALKKRKQQKQNKKTNKPPTELRAHTECSLMRANTKQYEWSQLWLMPSYKYSYWQTWRTTVISNNPWPTLYLPNVSITPLWGQTGSYCNRVGALLQ